MSKTKSHFYKKLLHEVCETFDGTEELVKGEMEETCFQQYLSVMEVTYFDYERLCLVASF